MGYDIQEDQSAVYTAYKILQKKLFFDPKNNFSLNDKKVLCCIIDNVSRELWEEGIVEITIKGTKKENVKFIRIKLKDFPYNKAIPIFKDFSSIELTPDYYQLILTIKNKNGKIVDSKKLNFSISGAQIVSHPTIFSKTLPYTNEFLLYYMLAYQADKINDNNKAEYYFKKVFNLNPHYTQGIIHYSEFLIKNKKFEKALEYIEKIKGESKFIFEYHLLKGIALQGLKRFSGAINSLLKANEIYNSDIRVLNSLGYCFFKLGKKEEALQVLKSSLALNPKQKDIENLIKRIENSKN